jgi:hypothetical protein
MRIAHGIALRCVVLQWSIGLNIGTRARIVGTIVACAIILCTVRFQ